MLLPAWERGSPWGTIPWDAARPALGSGGTLLQAPCRLRPRSVEGLLMAEHKGSLDQCLLLTLEISWLYSSESTKVTPWNSRILQVLDEKGIHIVLKQKLLL